MLQIGDLFLRKDSPGHYIHPVVTIAEQGTGTTIYEIAGCGYYTEAQIYDEFEPVTILEEAEKAPCPEALPSSKS
jgi:hypothetical protein